MHGLTDSLCVFRCSHHTSLQVEYAETFRTFWGHRSFVFAQILFFACMSCLNISSIVDTAQTIDTALGNFRGTAGLQISWSPDEPTWSWLHWKAIECTEQMDEDGSCLPFFDDDKPDSVILTVGYLACVSIFLPMALMDLKVRQRLLVVTFQTPSLDFFSLRLTSIGWVCLVGKCMLANCWIPSIDFGIRAVLYIIHLPRIRLLGNITLG